MELPQSCYCHTLGIENCAYTTGINAILCLLMSGNSEVSYPLEEKRAGLGRLKQIQKAG